MLNTQYLYPVKIIGLGKSVPKRRLYNSDIENYTNISSEWIEKATGIQSRYINDQETISQLSSEAALDAIAYASINSEDIDLIISATSIPDALYPSTACKVQETIHADNAVAFNIVAACSGFIFAMKIAYHLLTLRIYKKALITAGDFHSQFLNWNDPNTCILFGDGAGAMILESNEDRNDIFDIQIFSDGQKSNHLTLPIHGQFENPFLNNENYLNKKPYLQYVQMDGKFIYKFFIKILPEIIEKTLKDNAMNLNDIDYIIPHQANAHMIKNIARLLGVNINRIISEIGKFGNTSSASIPITILESIKNKKIKIPARFILAGFGAGLTWGIALIQILEKDKRIK